MWRGMLKIAAATALYGVVHSALASRAAKDRAAAWFGQRHRNGLYRLFYLTQSAATLAILIPYIRRQPGRELYHIRGAGAWWMRGGQLLALGYAVAAADAVGMERILGWRSFRAWLEAGDVPPEPEAQGPACEEGTMRVTGPFRLSRHPLNLVPVPIFWLAPHMTTNRLAFNVAATVYFVLGSMHEESRLEEAYGAAYQAYQQSGVPFYVPAADVTSALIAGSDTKANQPLLPAASAAQA